MKSTTRTRWAFTRPNDWNRNGNCTYHQIIIIITCVLLSFRCVNVEGIETISSFDKSHNSSSSQKSSAWNMADEPAAQSFSTSSDGQYELRFTISENVPIGTFIGIIKSDSKSTIPIEPPFLIVPIPGDDWQSSSPSSLSSRTNSNMRVQSPPYSIGYDGEIGKNMAGNDNQAGTVDTDLNIDQSNGEIRTAIELDRERRSQYSFIAISLTGVNIHVKIVIEDVNDNSPQFPTKLIELDFPENSKAREVKRTLPPAKDLDRGTFGTQSYRIISGNVGNAFRLVSHREKDDILYLDLQVNGILDRETISNYQLMIEALDGGQPPLKDQMTVKITILDHNDCEPIFSQSHYYGSVAENVTLGSSVLKVIATDNDQGENGQIEYSLHMKNGKNGVQMSSSSLSSSSLSSNNYFAINHSTGLIYVSRPLDFEAQELHELVVIARDQGAQPLETSAFVSIRVTDVNDNQPTINLLFLTENSKPEISEDAKIGDLVARVSVNDADHSDSFGSRYRSSLSSTNKRHSHTNRLSVSLFGANEQFSLRTQDQIIYLIVVTGKLDRERRSKYSLTVVVTDKGSPPLNTSTTFELEVIDVNDNAPSFDSSIYHTTLPEATDIGSSVFQMKATDLDSDSILTYAFIVPKNGFEYVDDDIVSGQRESMLLSTGDESMDESFFINYFNRHNSTHRLSTRTNWFSIDRRSGLIVTRTQVDCEADSEPKLTVLVTDSVPFQTLRRKDENRLPTTTTSTSTSFNGFTATATLVIAISDINDNEPIFDQSFYNVTISEDESVGACILQISASDPDCGVNALVNYSFAASNIVSYHYTSSSMMSLNGNRLMGGHNHNHRLMAPSKILPQHQHDDFRLDSKTGQLCIAKPLDYERTAVYDIPCGLSTTAMIKIQVIDKNDNHPVFYPPEYKVNVQLNAFENNHNERVPLVVIVATDLDSPTHRNGQITYSIESGNDRSLFEIDSNTVATDGDGLRSKVPALVQISVLPSETESKILMPIFIQRQFAFTVIENVAQGAVVGTVKAKIDSNGGNQAQSIDQPISYAIYSGDPDGYFSIDPRLGTIMVRSNNIDHEKYSHLMLNVQAYTGQYPGPYRYAHTQVNITILDENDNVPLFPSGSLKISVPENVPVDHVTPILVAYAIDYDSGMFGRIRYSLHGTDGTENSDSELPFNINESTGHVMLRRSLDYESRNEYKIRVVAIDGGQLSSEMIVDILVQDVNDNVPIFVGTAQTINLSTFGYPAQLVPLFNVKVPENIAVNVHFYQTKATDFDSGNNARLTYSLSPLNRKQSTPLPIDIFPNNGILYIRDALDRENVDLYEVLINVHDHGLPIQYNTSAVLRVGVTDINDNRPFWRRTSYTFAVGEDASSGTLIGQVDAFDVDLEGNATLHYNITDPNESTIFRINPSTGQIYIRSTLDRELKERYEFMVEVRDHGIPISLTGDERASVVVNVLDVNDNRPVFEFDTIENEYESNGDYNNRNVIKVPIGAARRSIVGSFRATDPDAGINGTVRYSLIDSNDLFEIDPETGALITKVDIKESSKHGNKISLIATDGMGKKSKVKTVEIEFVDKQTIQHINLDNVQTFNFVLQSSKTLETFMFGHRVGNIGLSVRDGKRGNNCGNRLFNNFNRQMKDNIPFFVDSDDEDESNQLILYFTGNLNQNETERFNLLLCVDWSQCSATLMHNYLETMPNQMLNHHLHHQPMLHCDHYAKVNVELRQSINQRCDPFPLDSNNDLYEVKIPWIGGAGESNAKQRRVNELIYLNQSTCNEHVQYELSSPMMEESILERLFVINADHQRHQPSTLVFRSHEKSLIHRYLLHQDFVLSLTARWKIVEPDQQKIEMVKSVPIRVKVLSSDNQIGNIIFVNERSFELEEDCCQVATPIVQARINVSHDDFRIRYFLASYGDQHLVGSDEQFVINSDSGLLTLKREFDYERKHEHRINITAVVYDSKSPIMSISHMVKIRLLNTNDESPVFTHPRYEKEVLENVPIGHLLLQLEAKDSDQPIQSNITYILSNSYEHYDYFQLDHHTGELKLAKSLDREHIEHFHVPIYAFDEDFQHHALTIVHIRILDINDNSPYFIHPNFELRIPESIQPGTIIHNIIAIDPDLESEMKNETTNSINGLQYRIVSGNVANKFVLHPQRGQLTTNSLLDREMQNSYQLVVEVSDSFYTSTCNISIELTDVNDNAPIFDKSDYYAILDLDRTYGWLSVITVRAIDSDGDKLLYTINTNQHSETIGNLTRLFMIDSESGEIRVHRSLVGPIFDVIKTNQFSFEVIAIEAAKNSYRSHQSTAKVHLTLVNDGRDGQVRPIDPNGIKLTKYPYMIIADAPRDTFYIGQEIGNIVAMNGLKHKFNYHIRIMHGGESYRSFNDYFNLNAQTGSITVKRTLNSNYYEAIVEVSSNDVTIATVNTQTILQVFIGGIDDRKFLKPVHLEKINVLESQPPGSEIVNLGSYIGHSLMGTKIRSRFMLAYSNLPNYRDYIDIESSTGIVQLKRSLDYESQPNKIELIAFSYRTNGNLHEDGHVFNVTIELLDVDDDRAQFTQNLYVGTIGEGDPTGSYVARVSAIDITTINRYNVSSMMQHAVQRYIFPPFKEVSISEDSPIGSIITTLAANDVDIYPTLSYSKLNSSININNNSMISIDKMIDIGLYTGRIMVKSSLKPLLDIAHPSELVRTIQLSISSSDQIHSVNTNITINVKRNQTNMVPRFKNLHGNFYLKLSLDSEHSQLLSDTNVEIFRIPMIEDYGNRKIIYKLESVEFESNFYIDESRGIIYNNRTMRSIRNGKLLHLIVLARFADCDRHVQASLLINVERSIGANSYHHHYYYKKESSLTNSAVQNHYQLEIDGSQIGVPILRLPKKQMNSYVIVAGNTNKNFLILRGNELVLASRPLTDQYTLKIKSMRSIPLMNRRSNATTLVHIKIRSSSSIDSSNTSPFKSSVFEIEINENEKIGNDIQVLKCTTVSNNDYKMFTIDSQTGSLSINGRLDYESITNYRLGVLAQSNIGSRNHFAVVNINLINMNEYCPRFASAHLKAIVDENSPPGSRVAPIKAIDEDGNVLNYTIVKLATSSSDSSTDLLNGPFRFDADSGYLVTTGQLDYEKQLPHHQFSSISTTLAVYKFIVRVSDMTANMYASGNNVELQCGSIETLLEVQIGSMDEFSPQFSAESYQFKVNMPTISNAAISLRSRLKIGQVHATDSDLGTDGIVRYSIKTISPMHLVDLVQINSTSGLISMSLSRMKNRLSMKKGSIPKQFSLIISASSGRVNSLHSLTMVDVQLSMVDLIDGFMDITEDEEIEEFNSIDDRQRLDGITRKEASLPGWPIFLIVLLFLFIIVLLVSMVIIRMHHSQQQLISNHYGRPDGPNMGSLFRKIGPLVTGTNGGVVLNGIDSNGISPAYSTGHYGTTTTISNGPPCYSDATLTSINPIIRTEMGQHSTSSGRGSAEDVDVDDVDEEIRMINESNNYYTQGPDSVGEEITTTAEYLARLGVSNHYEEEQENTSSITIEDDDDDEVDGDNVANVDESTDVLSEMGVGKVGTATVVRYGTGKKYRQQQRMIGSSSVSTNGTNGVANSRLFECGSMNSIIQHHEEELSGSYNWDYLQHWGPKYQPLSSVFAEIAKLKDPIPGQIINTEILENMSNRSGTS
ncbi:calcium ion binding, partial [Blomia tropicalis]